MSHGEIKKPLLNEGDSGYKEMKDDHKGHTSVPSTGEEEHGAPTAQPLSSFDPNGLTSAQADQRLQQYGRNELVEKVTPIWRLILRYFWGPEFYKPNPIILLMWFACIMSISTGDVPDFCVILGLIIVNGCIAWFENAKAGNAVAALKAALAPKAYVRRDGKWGPIDAALLVPGDLISLKLGDVVPADCVLCEGGTMDLDQSGLTGESLPVTKHPGELCFSGTVVKRGEMESFVQATGEGTEFGKTAKLIQSVESVGNFQLVLGRIAYVLIAFSLVLVIVLVFIQIFSNGIEAVAAVKQALILLVAAVPIAMPVVATATMAVGARRLSEDSAVVTRLSAIEELAGMTVLCSDKTGTLTKNILTLDEPWTVDSSITADEIKFQAALACKQLDPDAIDTCIGKNCPNPTLMAQFEQIQFIPFDPSNRKTEAQVLNKVTGESYRVTKGAPQVILKLAANREAIETEASAKIVEFAERGFRSLGVARTLPGHPDNEWYMMGILSLFDPPREDTKDTIERALVQGVSVKMITGDHLLIAKETARRLGMGTSILPSHKLHEAKDTKTRIDLVISSDGFAEVFPDDKFNIVATVQEAGHCTGMTGDGVNDAPALKKAQVGFAVHGATPAAQGAASVVLSTPGLSVIITAIIRSRKIFQRMNNYVIYRVNVSLQLLIFFFFATVIFKFHVPTLVVLLMALFNDFAVMSIAYDKVFPSIRPEKWRVIQLSVIGFVLAAVHAASSLLMLYWVTTNFLVGSFPNWFQLEYLLVPQQRGVIFIQLSLSAQISVYAARTNGFFFTRRPGFVLLAAMSAQMFIATLLGIYWPGDLYSTDLENLCGSGGAWAGIVWANVIITFLIADTIKVILRVIIDKITVSTESQVNDLKAEVRRRIATVSGQRQRAPTAVKSH